MASLLSRTLAGLGKTASLTAAKSAVDFAVLVALIRIYGDRDPIGQFAFLFVWVELFHRLSNFGGHRYLIQRRDLRREDLATVVTTEMSAALLWAVVWAVAAPMFFSGLGRGALASLCPVLAAWLVTERLGLPARAVLERDLRFGRSNGALLAGSLALGLVAIPLALAGWGVLAWVVGKVVQSAVTASLLWAFAGIRPALGWRGGALRPFLRFGLPLTAADLIQFYNWNVPIVVIGLAMGDNEVLALYWIAYKLPEAMLQLQSLVSTVVYPAFSRARDDRQLVEGFHLVTKYSAALAVFPVVLVLTLGLGVTRHILGEDYLQATRALQIFTALAAFHGRGRHRGGSVRRSLGPAARRRCGGGQRGCDRDCGHQLRGDPDCHQSLPPPSPDGPVSPLPRSSPRRGRRDPRSRFRPSADGSRPSSRLTVLDGGLGDGDSLRGPRARTGCAGAEATP
jgi:O-antigen/teichoic acid export membrane protein